MYDSIADIIEMGVERDRAAAGVRAEMQPIMLRMAQEIKKLRNQNASLRNAYAEMKADRNEWKAREKGTFETFKAYLDLHDIKDREQINKFRKKCIEEWRCIVPLEDR